MVLVPGKQAAEMIRRRANSSGLIVATEENVRTVDSFLMNYGRGPCQYKRLFLDYLGNSAIHSVKQRDYYGD